MLKVIDAQDYVSEAPKNYLSQPELEKESPHQPSEAEQYMVDKAVNERHYAKKMEKELEKERRINEYFEHP